MLISLNRIATLRHVTINKDNFCQINIIFVYYNSFHSFRYRQCIIVFPIMSQNYEIYTCISASLRYTFILCLIVEVCIKTALRVSIYSKIERTKALLNAMFFCCFVFCNSHHFDILLGFLAHNGLSVLLD